ncbi:MAG: squalene--hopene cyclase, partial [Planctomycetaceae bacterium]
MQYIPLDSLSTRPPVTPTPNPDPIFAAARVALDQLREELLAMRTPGGHWEGELSASALSTATAISALSALVLHRAIEPSEVECLIRRGLAYLDSQQNSDGGYGDTDRSHSNIATSYLVLAARKLAVRALQLTGAFPSPPDGRTPLDDYIASSGGLDGLRRRYGKDKTFVVPILTNLAIAGLVDWKIVPRLPFEAAVFPGSMYRFLQMPVVSYAIPALVAIGQVHHFRGPRTWWPLRQIRSLAVAPTMQVLQRMQPDSGGYLEATPLTSFVLMSLAASGRGQHPVAIRCLEFITASIRTEGSWPIDTNLATWVTSLAIHALAQDPSDNGSWATPSLIDWHLGCQHQKRHPFTGADPGGWGWTDHSGAVPDGDDTPAAILAIDQYLTQIDDPARMAAAQAAVARGASWLLNLQNRDGGLPTFCRGWGKLPFDRSGSDLTAHALRAIEAWRGRSLAGQVRLNSRGLQKFPGAVARGFHFLEKRQNRDGSWFPLWFGNQDRTDEENPVYGTAKVLLAYADYARFDSICQGGLQYLVTHQNRDG